MATWRGVKEQLVNVQRLVQNQNVSPNALRILDQLIAIQQLDPPEVLIPLTLNISHLANGTVGKQVLFTANVQGGKGPYSFTWNWGDGSAIDGGTDSLSHTYYNPGSFNVNCTVTDSRGTKAVDRMTVIVDSLPLTVKIVPDPTNVYEVGKSLVFGAAITGGKTPYSSTWQWPVGSSNGNVSDRLRVTFDKPGDYSVGITVRDSGTMGASNEFSFTIKGVDPQFPVEVNVGPNGAVTELHLLPINNLQPNTKVNVVYRGKPYNSKLVINRGNKLHLKAISGPNPGERVVLDAYNATENKDHSTFSSQLVGKGIISIIKPNATDVVKGGIKIEDFKLIGARRSNSYTDKNGNKAWYQPGAAGVYAVTCEDVEISGCRITDNENGIFSKCDSWGVVKNLAIRWCNIDLNGCMPLPGDPDAIYHFHNLYNECDGVIYENNILGKLVDGSAGAIIKDRSAGAIVRYNQFSDSIRQLDLVDPDAGEFVLKASPRWGKTFVHSNIFRNTIDSAVVNFGYDEDAHNTQIALYFYHNTLVNTGDQWKMTWLKVHGAPSKVYAGNNIFWNNSTDVASFFRQEGVGTYFHVQNNFVSKGTWKTTDDQGNPMNPDMDGWNGQVIASNPGLVQNLTLRANSICKGRAAWPLGWPIDVPTQGWNGEKWVERKTFTSLGCSE